MKQIFFLYILFSLLSMNGMEAQKTTYLQNLPLDCIGLICKQIIKEEKESPYKTAAILEKVAKMHPGLYEKVKILFTKKDFLAFVQTTFSEKFAQETWKETVFDLIHSQDGDYDISTVPIFLRSLCTIPVEIKIPSLTFNTLGPFCKFNTSTIFDMINQTTTPSTDLFSPLILSAKHNNLLLFSFLLEKKHKESSTPFSLPTKYESNCLPLLFTACYHGHIKIVESLLENEIDIKQRAKIYHDGKKIKSPSPTQIAHEKGHHEIVKLLIQRKENY